MPVPTAITNRIRAFIDDRLPRGIRDSPLFMYPLFWVWFKGKHVRTCMDFKRIAPALTSSELRDIYRRVESFADGRATDTHPEALAHVIDAIDHNATSLLDVGCGRGFFLRRLQEHFEGIRLTGCDFSERKQDVGRAAYVSCDAEALPFADRSFDVVTCFHTLEHTRRLDVAIAELRRVCRKQLIVVVPRQKYFFYTLDLHLQFFPDPAALENAMRMGAAVRQFGSDLVYIATV